MSKVLTDAPAASSPAPEIQQPSIEDRVNALSPDQRMHYRTTGELPEVAPKPDAETTAPTTSPEPTPENEPDSATGDEPQPESTDAAEKSRKRRERNAQRWEELLEERGALRREVELLRKQAAEGTVKPTPAEEKTPTSDRPKRPRLRDFEDIDAYEAAMDQYEDAKAAFESKQFEQRQSQAEYQRQRESQQRTWEQQVEAEVQANPKFREVAFSEKTPASDTMISVMKGHKVGAKIAFYLGQHPEEAARIAEASELPPNFVQLKKSNPAQAAYILGSAEAIVNHEFSRIAESIASPAASKPTPKPLPKPTKDVSVESRGSAVEDELAEAIKSGNQEKYNRLMNDRELREAGILR